MIERIDKEWCEKGFDSRSDYIKYIINAYWDFLENGFI